MADFLWPAQLQNLIGVVAAEIDGFSDIAVGFVPGFTGFIHFQSHELKAVADN